MRRQIVAKAFQFRDVKLDPPVRISDFFRIEIETVAMRPAKHDGHMGRGKIIVQSFGIECTRHDVMVPEYARFDEQ